MSVDAPRPGSPEPADDPVPTPAPSPVPSPAASPTEPDPGADPATAVRGDDDRDLGWGDDLDRAGGDGGRDRRWYEEQRPPHWE